MFVYSQTASPVANDQAFTVNEGDTSSGILTGTDSDSSSSNLSFAVVGSPTSGTLTIESNGSFTYVHSGGEGTSDSFTFSISDEVNNNSNTATVTITVTPVNDVPVIANISKTLDEGASAEINVSGSDAEGAILIYEIVTAPLYGTYTFDTSSGIGYYTHDGSETTTDTIVVKAKESTENVYSANATIDITITGVNDSPLSPDGTATVVEGQASPSTSFGAFDAEGSTLTINVSSQGSNGTAVVSGTDFIYTHDGSETTTDTFSYSTSDGTLSSTGTITVSINPQNDAPVGVADTYFITRNSTTEMDGTVGVLRNDTDSDSDSSTFSVNLGSTIPLYGQLTLNVDGSFTYITDGSNSTFNTDTFTYIVSDDNFAPSSEVTVTLEVAAILPIPNSYSNAEGATLTVDTANGVVTNDIEPNGLALTATVVANPIYGTLTLNTDGSFSYVHDGSENRADVFTYKLANANQDESKSTFVVINNTNVNDAPVSTGTSFTLNEGASTIFTPSYTDSDTELTGITFSILTAVTNGFLTDNGDGTFTYTHDSGETVSDTFVYSVSDGEFTVDNLTGSITVSPVNDIPTATDLTLNIDEASSTVINFAGTDAEGSDLGFAILAQPTNGSLSTVDGVTTYTHNGSEKTTDSFTYESYDGTAKSTAGTVSFTFNPVNSAPTVTAIAFTIDEANSSTFNLGATSTEPEGQAMTFGITSPTNGSATVDSSTGEVIYTHDGTETTSDTFTYTASDSDGLASTAGTITVTLNPVNDAPVIADATLNVDQYDDLTFNVPGSDAEGSALTYTITTPPTQGTLEDNGTGNYTYYNESTADLTGSSTTDTFVVTANDGTTDSAQKTLTFNIAGIDETKPQIILTSASSSITETDAGGATLTVNAILVSNDFYSNKRDMVAETVSEGQQNSLGYTYVGEYAGHKYYYATAGSIEWKTNGDAKSMALAQGGYLWTIESAAEENAVSTMLQERGLDRNDVWIGLNYDYTSSPNAWKWINGFDYDTYSNWVDYDTSVDGSGFLENPVAKWWSDGWRNRGVSDGGRILIEFDNNVTAASNIVFDVTATGDAIKDTDYTLSAATITILANESSGTLTLTETADTIDEPSESVILTASNVSAGNARIKSSQNTLALSIVDNEDTSVTFSTTKSTFSETDGAIVITAELANIKPFDTALTLALNGDATIDEDYSTDDDGYLAQVATGFSNPEGLVQATSGDYYVAEERRVYKVEANGTKTAYAGTGDYGTHYADAQPVTQAKFRNIGKMVIDKASSRSASGSADVIYLYDERVIRKIDLGNNLIYYITGSGDWSDNFVNGTFAESKFRSIRDITLSNDGSKLYVIDENAVRTIDLDNDDVSTLTGSRDWQYNDGTLSSARFEGPQGIAMNAAGDLIVRQYGKLRKIDIDGDAVTTLFENDWSSGDLFIDSGDNVYFASEDRHYIYKYSSDGELSKIIDSRDDSGTVDGVLKDAKIDRPMDIIVNSAGDLVFVERNGTGSLRKIDFVNKLRIPAGQLSGTFTLNINDDGSYENDENISVVVTSAESIGFTVGAEVLGVIIESDDSAPEVQLVSAASNIAEEGGSTILTFQLGNASESGARQDMSPGLKGEYEYLGAIGTHKYYMSEEYKTWTEARDIATDLGGYLVAVDAASENQWIRDQMESAGYQWNSVWIGYTDQDSEGIFEWANGSQSTYENWQNGEPNNSGGEDYTELMSNGKWNDLPNNNTQKFIIEFSGTVSSLPTVITYTAVESNSVTSQFTTPTVAPITIAAGSSKATLTISANSDTIDEGTDIITYTITEVTSGTIGSKAAVTVSIDDNDLPTASITAISDPTLAEESGQLAITATIPNAKPFESSLGITVNQGGSDTAIYGTDFEISELQNVTTLAGSGTSNYLDGTGASASFNNPGSIVSDGSGNLYVADGENNVVRKVTTAGVVTTYAGNGDWAHDRDEGFRTDVGLANPRILVFNAAGELLVFENGRHRLSKIDTSGNVTRVIGNGNWGDQDGDKNAAEFRDIRGMAFDSSGNLFVSDDGKIKKISFDAGSGDASSATFAGTGNWGEADGAGNEAEFRSPGGIVIDGSDVLYVADRHNHKIRKITPSGEVSTYAGDGYGFQNGSLLSSRFKEPFGMSRDASGDIYIAEADGNRIRKIDVSASSVSTVAGSGTYGHLDSDLLSSKFKRPSGVLATASAIYIADSDNHRIRKIELLPSISIPAGSTTGTLTLKGIDDFKYETNETLTLSVSSYTNVNNSSIADISATVTSADAAPVARISLSDDVLDEEGTGTLDVTVSLSDAYSSTKIDMSASDKADYYYLGSYNGSKYYSSKNQNHYNYSEAKSAAAILGGQLAIITSPSEQETIVSGIYAQDPDYSADDNVWLNHWIGYDFDDTNWVWENGVTSGYENWTDTWQRDEHPSREAAYLHTNGLWHSTRERDHRRFVVEFSSAISDSETVVDISFADANSSGTSIEGAAGADFTSNLTSGKLTIAAGSPSGSLVLTAVDDSDDESVEQFTVSLDAATGATVDTDASNTSVNVMINDNELTTVTLSVQNAVTEISEVDGQATLLATLLKAKLNPVEVNLTFADSGALVALFGTDYDSSDLNAVSTFAGSGNSGYLDGDAEDALFSNDVRNMISDASGNIYIADKENRRIRKVDSKGTVSTYNNGADNGDTELSGPTGMAFDSSGNMYVAEEWNNRISKIDPSGNVTRFANQNGDWGNNNGEIGQASFEGTKDLAFDSQGNLFVLENHRIRKIEFSGAAASISNFVGSGNWGDEDGQGESARFGNVQNIVIDATDNIYYADQNHQKIKKVTPEGVVTTIAGNGNWGYADGFGTSAKFREPHTLAISSSGVLFVSDVQNNRIRKIELQSDGKYKVSTVAGNGNYGYVDGIASVAEFKRVQSLLEVSGTLYAYDADEDKLRKLLLNPVMSIAAGSTSATFNISGIDDNSYESTELISVTPSASGANLASAEPLTLNLTSNEQTPKVVLKSNSTVLDEENGTLTFDVLLVDALGAAANWTSSDLPASAADNFDFVGEYNGHKYYFSKNNYSWTQAKQNALDLGGQMLVIEDADENEFVSSIMIHNGTWVGYSRATEADSWANIYGTSTYQNFGGDYLDGTGYTVTYGNEWYSHGNNDNRHYILEYGPVASSELESSVIVNYSGNATFTGDPAFDDYSSSGSVATIAANSQKTTITLTSIDDSIDEQIEEITVSLALKDDNTSNVVLGDLTTLTFKINDDEEPKVTYQASATEISENGGSVTITAELSNTKLNPTVINLSLLGTATKQVDYQVSSIYQYSEFAGLANNPGNIGGAGNEARFSNPNWIIAYTNNSYLVYDDAISVIKKIDSNGNVSNFLGQPFQSDGSATGDASQTAIYIERDYGGMTADLVSGNVFWTNNQGDIMGWNSSDNQINKIYDGSDTIGGIAFLNDEIYFTMVWQYQLKKLTWNGSSFTESLVAGNSSGGGGGDTGAWYNFEDGPKAFSENINYYPGELVADPSNNILYSSGLSPFQNYATARKRITAFDLNTSTFLTYENLLPDSGINGSISVGSNGDLYVPSGNELFIISKTGSGILYNLGEVEINQFNLTFHSALQGNTLVVSNYDSNNIGKINLDAAITIDAEQLSNTITLSAFKDPWFESNEIIDVNYSNIVNGYSDSTDITDTNIIESTKLTLVADAPFEGVENGKVSWGDYDRDGDMDLALMGDASTGTITNVYKNNGEGGFTNTLQNFTKVIGGDIEFVDVDQDGYLDVAVSGNSASGRVSKLYTNISGQYFEESVSFSEQVEGLSQSDMEWADVDNDSDPDLIISGINSDNQFVTLYYTNIGNGNFFKEELFNMDGFIRGEIDIVDKDNDGDNDLFISGVSGSVGNQFYQESDVDNTYYWGGNNSDVGKGLSDGNTEYLDIDGDGLMDYLSIGRNDINSTQVDSRSNLNDLNYLPKLLNTDFDFADYNNDGLSDVVISGEDVNTGLGVTKLYVTFADYYGDQYQLVETDLVLEGLRESSVDWIDYDKDGDLDLFLTGLDTDGTPKSLLYKAENANNLNTPPAKVENVVVQGRGGNGTLAITWDKPNDDYSNSFRYSVRVGTTPGGSDILYSNSISDAGDKNGSTLLDVSSLTTRTNTFLTVLPGTYYVSVQAIDGGNMGGPFSDEVSATVDYSWNLQRLGGIIDRRLRTDVSTTIKFIDIDKDGDKDLIGGNVGTQDFGKSAINVFAFQNDIFEPKRGFLNGVSSFEIADFNKDGNEDLIVGVEENNGTRIYMLLNTYDQDEQRTDGVREYFKEYDPFEGDNLLESVYNIKFAVKDLNNDGLVDVLAAGESSKISSEATAVVGVSSLMPFTEGQLSFNSFYLSPPKSIGDDKLSDLSFISFDFGDIDNDSDFDFLISGYGFDGYQTILYENKRLLDENDAVVQPIEVYFEEKETNFVSVKEGTTQFVDFDSDGKLDIIFSGQSEAGDVFTSYKNTGDNNFAAVDLSLPAVRDGKFTFGDMFGRGVNDVVYSGTVSGQGTFSRIAYFEPSELKFYESGYDLFLDDADIGMADFDGDLDTDLVLSGKWNGNQSSYNYHGYVYINVRGYDQGSVANSDSDNGIKTSSANGVVKQTSSSGSGGSSGSSLNSRPTAPSSITVQKQRIADDSYDVIISWNAGSDGETPVDALTYSLKIGTSDGGEEILTSGANASGVRNTGTAGNASTNKSWKLTLPTGTYYAAVQAVDASFIGSEFSSSKEFTVTIANKLGDSNGDDSVNILDLTSNLDYILGNDLKVFVEEVADVNGDGAINVTDISGIVSIILNDPGAAQGSSYDPYVWEYFSNKPIGDASLIRRDGKIFLENDKPVTSLQFSFDSSVEYELSEEMKNMTVVNFVKDGMRTFVIYSYNNQRIDDLTNVVFDYLDLNDGDDFEIKSMSAGTDGGLSLSLRYSDESFFDDSEDIIQIYPNPAVSNVNLLTDITKNIDNIEVDIYNVLGVSVYKTNIKSISRLNDLDVSMLSSGVYTVRVRMITDKNEEIINVHKLIKK